MATHAHSTPAPTVQPPLLSAIAVATAGIKSTMNSICAEAIEALLGALAPHGGAPLLSAQGQLEGFFNMKIPSPGRDTHILSTLGEAAPPLERGDIAAIGPHEGGAQAVYPSESIAVVTIPCEGARVTRIPSEICATMAQLPAPKAFDLPDIGELTRVATVVATAARTSLERHADTPIPVPKSGQQTFCSDLSESMRADLFPGFGEKPGNVPFSETASTSKVLLKSEDSDFSPLLPPAPLPDLPTAFSRRTALFGAVSATGFLAVAAAATMGQGVPTAQAVPALDPADALASPLWAKYEFKRYYIDQPGDEADWLNQFTLRMMDNTIAVLRSMIGVVS